MLYSADWNQGGYDIFCTLDLRLLCCILQTGMELVMMYSTDWILAGYAAFYILDLSQL